MIGCLIGEVFALEAPTVLLNVNGVGYEIDTPLSTFCQLQKGQKVTLWTHLVVREDAQQLYGFSEAQEKIIDALGEARQLDRNSMRDSIKLFDWDVVAEDWNKNLL